MALWLDLLPRIHQPDTLDPRYHLLDGYDNLTSFEEEGTRLISLEELLHSTTVTTTTVSRTDPLSSDLPSSLTYPLNTTLTFADTTTTGRVETSGLFSVRPSTLNPQKFSDDDDDDGAGGSDPAGVFHSGDRGESGGGGGGGHSLSLGVTVVVGCSLLVLNVIIFAGVYHQKARLRQERRLMKIELEQEHDSSSRDPISDLRGSTRSNAYTNCGVPHRAPPTAKIPPAPLPPIAARTSNPPPPLPVLPHVLRPPPPECAPSARRLSVPPTTTPCAQFPSSQYRSNQAKQLSIRTAAEPSAGILKNSAKSADKNRPHHLENPSTVV